MDADRIAIHPHDVETHMSDWVTAKILCETEMFPTTSMGAVSIFFDPGQGHFRHNHPDAEQIIFVIAGEAEMMIEHEEGHPRYETIRAGSLVHIPKGAYHATLNKGWEPVRILAVYHPPGPEGGMRHSGEFSTLPPGGIPAREPPIPERRPDRGL